MNDGKRENLITARIRTRLKKRVRKRGLKEIVSLTFRLTRPDWERMHNFALSEGVSLQSLGVEGLSMVLVESGLPPLTGQEEEEDEDEQG